MSVKIPVYYKHMVDNVITCFHDVKLMPGSIQASIPDHSCLERRGIKVTYVDATSFHDDAGRVWKTTNDNDNDKETT